MNTLLYILKWVLTLIVFGFGVVGLILHMFDVNPYAPVTARDVMDFVAYAVVLLFALLVLMPRQPANKQQTKQ